jgi:hypothetical protein
MNPPFYNAFSSRKGRRLQVIRIFEYAEDTIVEFGDENGNARHATPHLVMIEVKQKDNPDTDPLENDLLTLFYNSAFCGPVVQCDEKMKYPVESSY